MIINSTFSPHPFTIALSQGLKQRATFEMNDELREMAEARYREPEFLKALFDLALEEKWFELQHVIQHDMAKAILADYSLSLGQGYLNKEVFYDHWEEVIAVGWESFCKHTGMPLETVQSRLAEISNTF